MRPDLGTIFREELHDNLAVLAEGLRELEEPEDADVTAAVLQDLFRAAHSLKGAAHSAGVNAAVQPCRRLEERFAAVRAGEVAVDEAFLTEVGDQVAALAEVGEQLDHVTPGNDADSVRSVATTPAMAETRARVAVRALDDLVHQTAALTSTTDQLRVLKEYLGILQETLGGALGGIIADFNDLERSLGRAVRQISATAQRLRMEPIEDVAAGMDHIVRELSRTVGKQVSFVLEGGDVELDRDVADAVREPLLHLVRNAVDHGIELPARRLTGGKSASGTVRVAATLDGARVRITVSDDGAGLDLVSLRIAAGPAASGDGPELAFLPGVTTAPSVTDVSGRGVGLDAVRAKIESLGGSVRLDTRPGVGTDVTVHVPTSLAVLRVILVRVGSELVALPVAALERFGRAMRGQVRAAGGCLVVSDLAGGERPAVDLGAVLGIPGRDLADRAAIVIELAGEDTALLVDAVESDRETLLQPLPPRMHGHRMLLGAVFLPQERVALVVNPATCVREGRLS